MQETNKDPLTLAQDIAQTAGGDWIAFADKPLDEINWPTDYQGMATPPTIKDALGEIKRAGVPVVWDAGQERVLVCFGPQTELDRLKTQSPQEVVGLFVGAPNEAELIRTIEGVWKVQIHVAPDLLKRRSDLNAARRKPEDEEESSIFDSIYGVRRAMLSDEAEQQPDAPQGLQFRLIGRNRPGQVLDHLAEYLGGAGHSSSENVWDITPLTDPKEIASRIAKLKSVIEERAGAASDAGTSYSSRQTGNGLEAKPTAIYPLDKEAQAAFDGLVLLDKAALPTLTAYLDPERASVAQGAMRALSVMNLPEADTALVGFAQKLRGPLSPGAKSWAPLLQTELIRIVALRPDATTKPLLTAAACDPNGSPQSRFQARKALWASGDLTPFAKDAGSATVDAAELQFDLATPTASAVKPPAAADSQMLTPLATTKPIGGEFWAVFVSGRLGDSNDLWLAHTSNGKWTEFLFTAQQFHRSQEYAYSQGPPGQGSCALKVEGDRVTISPPDPNLARRLAQAQQAMQNSTDQQARQLQTQNYYQLVQKNAQNLDRTLTLSLKDLRKDSDNDGLPDLVEIRLGMDPKTADMNGDGVPDGKDPNPQAPRTAACDRVTLLQMVYTAALGGDPSHDPILVLLPKESWQAFHGARARTLCMTREEYARLADHLSTLRVLEFGGPTNPGETILHADGPCLFNDDRTRAEVHFWIWNSEPGGMNEMAGNPYGMPTSSKLPSDYVALFEKKGEWKLLSIQPWKFRTADRSVSEAIKRMQEQNAYGGRIRY